MKFWLAINLYLYNSFEHEQHFISCLISTIPGSPRPPEHPDGSVGLPPGGDVPQDARPPRVPPGPGGVNILHKMLRFEPKIPENGLFCEELDMQSLNPSISLQNIAPGCRRERGTCCPISPPASTSARAT